MALTADGSLIGALDALVGEEEVLAFLRDVLVRHPDHDTPSPEEREWARRAEEGDAEAARALAGLALARGDHGAAIATLAGLLERLAAGSARDRVAYELGHACRSAGRFDEMERAFSAIGDPLPLADDLCLERARRLAAERRYAELRDALADHDPVLAPQPDHAPPPRHRATEAVYWLGVAHHHLGDADRAEALWRALVKRHAPDPWVYRADWAVFEAVAARAGESPVRSQLGRAYAGRAQPDLVR